MSTKFFTDKLVNTLTMLTERVDEVEPKLPDPLPVDAEDRIIVYEGVLDVIEPAIGELTRGLEDQRQLTYEFRSYVLSIKNDTIRDAAELEFAAISNTHATNATLVAARTRRRDLVKLRADILVMIYSFYLKGFLSHIATSKQGTCDIGL